ncbi:hypothetical protein AB0904_27590 [Streptomyces sp. NPDC006684]|uniref:hypothetical protein n=1 Tax=Streptomyces sp. NPDC006684 TaxID=3154477 RepID=UPI00345295C3
MPVRARRRDFDPARCYGNCPVCGQIVGSQTGEPTTIHQPPGDRSTCPGSGQPAL